MKFVFLMIMLIALSGTTSSYSQVQTGVSLKTETANKIEFVRSEDNVLVFDLKFSEIPPKGCTLVIMDDSDNPVYEEFITGSFYSKRYKILRENLRKISFKASAKGFSFNQTFKIEIEERLMVTTE